MEPVKEMKSIPPPEDDVGRIWNSASSLPFVPGRLFQAGPRVQA